MSKLEILKQAAEQRSNEVENYQINIDNFRLAIEEIDANHADDPAMAEFKARLQGLLDSSRTEQKKEQIMLTVIERQIKELEQCSA